MGPSTRSGKRGPGARRPRPPARDGGFTLIELLIVVAIIGIIAGIATVQLRQTPIRAKESVLKENLYVMRDVLDQYFADRGKYPESLETLVEEGYLRRIPVDPFTESDTSWEVEYSEASDDDPDSAGGVIDVRSGATGTALDGTQYSEW